MSNELINKELEFLLSHPEPVSYESITYNENNETICYTDCFEISLLRFLHFVFGKNGHMDLELLKRDMNDSEECKKLITFFTENNTYNFYTCDPSENQEHMYIGFLARGNNPNDLCMPCCFKKDQLLSNNTLLKKIIFYNVLEIQVLKLLKLNLLKIKYIFFKKLIKFKIINLQFYHLF